MSGRLVRWTERNRSINRPSSSGSTAGDAEHVVDHAARARSARRAADAAGGDQSDDVGDGEEVRRVPQLLDDGEFVRQPVGGRGTGPRVAPVQPGLAPSPQHGHRRRPAGRGGLGQQSPVGVGDRELGQVRCPDSEVSLGIEHTAQRDGPGRRKKLPAAPFPPSGPVGHLVSEQGHLLAGLEVPLRVAALDVPSVEGDQPAGGVEHIQSGPQPAIGHPYLVGQHGGRPAPVGEGEQSGGVGQRSRPHTAAELMGDGDDEVVGFDQFGPTVEGILGEIGPVGGHRCADVGVGTQQDPEVAGGSGAGDLRRGGLGPTTLAVQVGCGNEPAEGGPPVPVPGEDADPRRGALPSRPATHRGPGSGCGLGRGRLQREVDPDDRADPEAPAGLDEADRAVETVAVGEAQQIHLVLRGPFDQGVRLGRAVPHGVRRGDPEVDEGVGHRLLARFNRARCAGASGPCRRRTRARRPRAGRNGPGRRRLARSRVRRCDRPVRR